MSPQSSFNRIIPRSGAHRVAGIAPSLYVLLSIALLAGAGCSPSMAPLFRDFESEGAPDETEGRMMRALEAAGWEQVESQAPNALRTSERILNRRLVYKTVVTLEVVPIGDEYIRVFIHPYRDNLIGGKSKIPYLQSNVRRKILPPLTEAFEEEGLVPVGHLPPDSLARVGGE